MSCTEIIILYIFSFKLFVLSINGFIAEIYYQKFTIHYFTENYKIREYQKHWYRSLIFAIKSCNIRNQFPEQLQNVYSISTIKDKLKKLFQSHILLPY